MKKIIKKLLKEQTQKRELTPELCELIKKYFLGKEITVDSIRVRVVDMYFVRGVPHMTHEVIFTVYVKYECLEGDCNDESTTTFDVRKVRIKIEDIIKKYMFRTGHLVFVYCSNIQSNLFSRDDLDENETIIA